MTEPDRDESTPATLLILALAEYARRVDSGVPIDREAFVVEYPGIAEKLRACLAASDQADRLVPPEPTIVLARASVGNDAPTFGLDDPMSRPPLGTIVRYFGDYELLEEIARGG